MANARRTSRNLRVLVSVLVAGAPLLSGCAQQGESLEERNLGFTGDLPVFLNEIHYDNVGTDAGESIEIAGPAGTDLSGYTLVLYNGGNGAPYGTTNLSGTLLDQQNGFGTLSFSFPANGIQNGSPDGIALVDATGTVLQFLSYEGSFAAMGGPADGLTSTDIGVVEGAETPLGFSLSLSGSGDSSADFSWSAPSASSFGAPNPSQTFGEAAGTGGASGAGGGSGTGGTGNVEVCGEATTPIAAVQGPGETSPLVGQTVSIEGIVVGDFQGTGTALGGFFVQSESPDTNPLTSEGVFVFDQNLAQPVSVGERIRVRGQVAEYFGVTEVVAEVVLPCGAGALPAPSALPLPFESESELEALEGMLVVASGLTVTETFNLGRFGEVVLSSGGRLFHPNSEVSFSSPNERRRIVLDDGRDGQNLEPVPYLGTEGTLRLGDTLQPTTVILHYAFGAYRLEPVDLSAVAFARTNERPSAPASVGGDLRIASLNVLNYFVTLNDRGANSALELARQREKLVQAVLGLDADVLGLMEIENDPGALDDFVASVNAALGAEVYVKAPEPDFTGTDAIRTAIVYKGARVTPVGPPGTDESPVFSRPPLAQSFSFRGNVFSVVVNHFKSKGSCPSSATDPNADFGQGCWNVLRTEQSTALLSFLEEIRASAGDPDVVVLGDLNSYLGEDPIRVLEDGGLVNQIRSIPETTRYSYVFGGESGVLDYALTSPSLAVSGATLWHINADEPRILDYNTEFNPSSAFQSNAFRSSDHDPVLLGIRLVAEPGVLLDALLDRIVRSRLPPFDRIRLITPLRLAELALEFGRPGSARAQALRRRLAVQKVENFLGATRDLVARGRLAPSLGAEFLARGEELRDALLAPVEG